MTNAWLRRVVMVAAALSAAFLAGCGSSTIDSALKPSRFISFGDAFSDLGQGGTRYTVNDAPFNPATVNIWTQKLASTYGKTLTVALDASGVSYATGNARITQTPDAAAGAAPTIQAQITTFLGASAFGANDVALINGGYSDIIVNVMRVLDPAVSVPFGGTITQGQALANISQAGTDLGTQVRRLVNNGAKYVVVAGVYDLSKSPWATAISQTSLLSQASAAFNQALLISIADLGANVLYVDTAAYFNLLTTSPTTYSLTNAAAAACDATTAADAGNGIGTGTGKINSALCTTATITAGQDYTKYVFADQVYPTPAAQTLWGTQTKTSLAARW